MAVPLTPTAAAGTQAKAAVGVPTVLAPTPNTWDNLASLGTWDYVAHLYASWDDLYHNRQQPALPVAPIPGAGVTPDLAGLSLAGAYQAGLAAGYTNFQVIAYRQSYMSNPEGFPFLEAAPAVGYVAQTTSPGSAGVVDPNNPGDGSFYTTQEEVGVPDQTPDPGTPVATNGTLRFVFQVSDDRPQPNDVTGWATDGPTPDSGTWIYWEYGPFSANNVPPTLQDSMNLYNGLPLAPVDVGSVEWPLSAQDPLVVFTAPPPVEPADLLSDVPPYEQGSYEIAAVLRVVAGELGRIGAAQGGLTQQWFPATADAMLGRFESMLGLPVEPQSAPGIPVPLGVRRSLVLAYMQRLRTEGTGLDWEASMTSLAGTAWDYQEHDPANPSSPPAYTMNVDIPQVFAAVGWNFVRDITPAHIGINQGYTGGWLVGIALLDNTLL